MSSAPGVPRPFFRLTTNVRHGNLKTCKRIRFGGGLGGPGGDDPPDNYGGDSGNDGDDPDGPGDDGDGIPDDCDGNGVDDRDEFGGSPYNNNPNKKPITADEVECECGGADEPPLAPTPQNPADLPPPPG